MFVDEVKKLQNEEEHEKELNADRSNGQMLEFLSLKLGKCPDFVRANSKLPSEARRNSETLIEYFRKREVNDDALGALTLMIAYSTFEQTIEELKELKSKKISTSGSRSVQFSNFKAKLANTLIATVDSPSKVAIIALGLAGLIFAILFFNGVFSFNTKPANEKAIIDLDYAINSPVATSEEKEKAREIINERIAGITERMKDTKKGSKDFSSLEVNLKALRSNLEQLK